MLDPSLTTLAAVAASSLALALGVFAATLGTHVSRRRQRAARSAAATRLALQLAELLTGRADAAALRRSLEGSSADVLWDALERFSDNISGHEWLQISQAICEHPVVIAERGRLRNAGPARRALAARRIGMISAPQHGVLLNEAMRRGPLLVRLSAVLALARARDVASLRWLLRFPGSLDPLGRHLGVAILKRYGSRQRGLLRRGLDFHGCERTLDLAAVEVLGLWRDRPSRVPLEQLLHHPNLDARVSAARALGRIGARKSLAVLREAAGDDAWQVRAQVARALGAIRARESVPVLAGLMTDSSWWVRRNAAYALAAQGDPGRAGLYRIAELGTDAFAREMAIEVMQADEWDRRSPGGLENAA